MELSVVILIQFTEWPYDWGRIGTSNLMVNWYNSFFFFTIFK